MGRRHLSFIGQLWEGAQSMSLNLERLPIFLAAETISDEVWQEVANWSRFDREVIGS
jgi:hypothetical protein